MFVGHAALAFALAAGAATWFGAGRERAIAVGLAAGAFALAPDVDVIYALVGVARVGVAEIGTVADAFWATGNRLHREVTHSLVLAAPAAAGFVLASRPRTRFAGMLLLAGLVAIVGLVGGAVPAVGMVAFAIAGVAAAVVAGRRLDLPPRVVLAAALVGLVTHPPGDLFTGEPPAMLYPFSGRLVGERVALSADPTLHLLGAFGLELATVWLAALVACRLAGYEPVALVDRRAVGGVGFAATAFVLPPPTLEVAHHFVFGVLAVGTVGAIPGPGRGVRRWIRRVADSPRTRASILLTGLTAVTLGGAAYAVAYLLA